MAAAYFIEKGYELLHQNWRFKNLEVDIIAVNMGILHFIEVKTRRTRKFGRPEDQVDKKKIKNMINAAEQYLYQFPQWKRIQFDILAITMVKHEPIEYFFIEDIYL